MRLKLAFILLFTTTITPALAEDIAAQSVVDAVTVFPSGAEVTRTAQARLAAGEHTLIFDGLPGDLAPETVRVEGVSTGTVEIGSVDTRLIYLPSTALDARHKEIEADIQKLTDERARLDQTIADAEYQKGLMQQLAANAFQPRAKDEQPQAFDAQGIGQLLDLVGGKLEGYSRLVSESRLRQREIDQSIADLNTALAQLAPQEQARMMVSVNLSAAAPASGTFKLRYRVAGAGWQPVYDARLTSPSKSGPARIELVRRAQVVQSTAERWDGVALTLSTARPVGATAAPDLAPQQIDGYEPERAALRKDEAGNLAAPAPVAEAIGNGMDDMDANKPKSVEQRQAEVQLAGFQALYAIPGRVTVDNTGTAKNVRIDTTAIAASLSALAVPKLDPNAYLTAAFKLPGDAPLLPGPAMLYRDGVYMGQGNLPMLSPGEEAKLGFGADDLIRVKRMEVRRQTGEEGLLTTSKMDVRAYDITVDNLHDIAMPVTILDQMPYATQEAITVTDLPGMTRPSIRDFEKKRGVLAWSFDLEPGAERVLKHGYKVTWPEGYQVGMNLN
ncbi:MAG: mucoidy inhibitor MuiA family protein [Hyphomicrobiales bacterium]